MSLFFRLEQVSTVPWGNFAERFIGRREDRVNGPGALRVVNQGLRPLMPATRVVWSGRSSRRCQ